ncbi:MAG: ROK family protein, partial [Nocardioidaceae bacterium]
MSHRTNEPAPPRRTARSLFEPLTLGVDIGGTKVLAGVVDSTGHVVAHTRRETPERSTTPRAVEDTIVAAVSQLRATHPVAAVGIGAAGFVDASRTTVLF